MGDHLQVDVLMLKDIALKLMLVCASLCVHPSRKEL